ncbi:hypothetical protein GS682_32635 [Nostoc sp. B(2019)]|nr:hypothetical protein [Nostoc sp. B(2019)]
MLKISEWQVEKRQRGWGAEEKELLSRDRIAGLSVIKVAGNVSDGHLKDHPLEWEAYEGVDTELAIAALKPWNFQLIEYTD